MFVSRFYIYTRKYIVLYIVILSMVMSKKRKQIICALKLIISFKLFTYHFDLFWSLDLKVTSFEKAIFLCQIREQVTKLTLMKPSAKPKMPLNELSPLVLWSGSERDQLIAHELVSKC